MSFFCEHPMSSHGGWVLWSIPHSRGSKIGRLDGQILPPGCWWYGMLVKLIHMVVHFVLKMKHMLVCSHIGTLS